MQLLTSQKNELYDLIESSNINPSQFEFQNIPSITRYTEVATKLIYKNTNFYYIFDTGRNNYAPHYCYYCPAKDQFSAEQYPGSWDLQKNYFQDWLNSLKHEISSEDKWGRLERELSKFSFNFTEDNDYFSAKEYEELSLKIEIIKTEVKSLWYNENQLDKMEKTLDYLKEKAKTLGKFDWKNLFIGTIMTYSLEFALPHESIASLMQVIKKALGTFFLN